ncbi:MAG: hypothetical protein [Microviridae sp.]|nr:MAG: hypothetical protein [Microviridae sp.]
MADLAFPGAPRPPQQLALPGASFLTFGRQALSGVGGLAGLAAQMILAPSPLAGPNEDEIPYYLSDPRYINPTFHDLDVYSGGFDVVIPGQETVVTPDLVWASLPTNAPSDAPVSVPPEARTSTGLSRLRAGNERIKAIENEIDALFKAPPRDLVDLLPSTVRPARLIRSGRQADLLRTISIFADKAGMRVKVDTKSIDPRYNSRKRDADQKMGRKAYRAILRTVNRTYGTATEIADFVDSLKVNTWVALPSGNIVSLAGSDVPTEQWARWLISGQAQIDFPGLMIDVAFNQAEDAATALGSSPFEFARSHAPFWTPDQMGARGQQKGINDVLTSPLLRSLSQLRSRTDLHRRARIARLFGVSSSLA